MSQILQGIASALLIGYWAAASQTVVYYPIIWGVEKYFAPNFAKVWESQLLVVVQ
jgi:hypothetical protein